MSERDLIKRWILWRERERGGHFAQKDLAESAGLSSTYLSSIMTGSRNAGTKTMDRLFGSFDYALDDEPQDTSFPSGPQSDFPEEPVDEKGPNRGISLLTGVPVGHWRSWDPGANGYPLIPRTPSPGDRVFGVRMDDDSMVPIFEPDMLLVVDPEAPFSRFDGGIGVIAPRERFTVRRIYRRGNAFVLVPANSAYLPETIDSTDVPVFKIVLIIPPDAFTA